MATIRQNDYTGGLNEGIDTEIKDNELSAAMNVDYDDQLILQQMPGDVQVGNTIGGYPVRSQFVLYRANGEAYHIATAGTNIYRRVFMLHNCDTYNGNGTWVASEDADSVATDAVTFQQGTGSVKFNITVATDVANRATVTNSTMTARDISDFYNTSTSTYGKIRVRATIPSVTNFTSVTLDVGTNSSNYFSKTVTTTQSGGALGAGVNLLEFDLASATETGTVTVTSIGFLRVRYNYAAGYTNQTNCRIDDIYIIHPTVALGDSWDSIASGLTSGKRFTAKTYRDIIHMVNGSNYMQTWDGLTATTTPSSNPPIAKYIYLLNGRAYLGGLASPNQSQIVYTATLPADLTTAGRFSNSQEFDPNDGSVVVGFGQIDKVLAVCKRKKVMTFDPNTSPVTVDTIDPVRGPVDQYSIVNVEDDLYFASDDGIYSVVQREATDLRFKSIPITVKIKTTYGAINLKTEIVGIYHDYRLIYSITQGSQTNSELIIIDTRMQPFAITKCNFVTADSFVRIRDASNKEQLYYGHSTTGKVFRMYDGASSHGNEYTSYFDTKNFDYGEFDTYKLIEKIAVQGYAALESEFTIKAFLNFERTASLTKTIDNIEAIGDTGVVGSGVVGTEVLGGTSSAAIPEYYFLRRRSISKNATHIKIRFENTGSGTPWKFLGLALTANSRGKGYSKDIEKL